MERGREDEKEEWMVEADDDKSGGDDRGVKEIDDVGKLASFEADWSCCS